MQSAVADGNHKESGLNPHPFPMCAVRMNLEESSRMSKFSVIGFEIELLEHIDPDWTLRLTMLLSAAPTLDLAVPRQTAARCRAKAARQ